MINVFPKEEQHAYTEQRGEEWRKKTLIGSTGKKITHPELFDFEQKAIRYVMLVVNYI